MFRLKADIILRGRYSKFINKKEISKYLEHVFMKSVDESIDDYNAGIDNKIDFIICKDKINCHISCSSYEKVLQIAQVVLKLDNLNFLDYEFEVKSLELKELEETDISNSIVNFGTY
ncbi:hypothetical protein [Clostridium thailandense]|uniref:Uncharacterized protein n=1 Tax=Clostridium thailandense TaxID=2794346 RepID=A0A949TJU2_9CLOT|nr:hypothetical protein [Clostridium thailandense]MBV7273615.1 hypothetical protein [Clostridium thailandense]